MKTKRKKAGTASWYKKKAQELAKAIARSKGRCEWCGRTANLQGAHILSAGAHPNMSADPENILCLCYHCHLNVWHKDPGIAFRWFEGTFPGRYDRLMATATSKPPMDWQATYDQLQCLPMTAQKWEI